MAAGEDRREQLLDDSVLPHDHPLQLFLHQPSMLAELLEYVSQAAGFRGQRESLLYCYIEVRERDGAVFSSCFGGYLGIL
jgi:hypothetical protein